MKLENFEGFFPLEIKHTNNIHHLRAKILKQKLVLIRLKQDTDIKMSVCILIYSNHIIKNQKHKSKNIKQTKDVTGNGSDTREIICFCSPFLIFLKSCLTHVNDPKTNI